MTMIRSLAAGSVCAGLLCSLASCATSDGTHVYWTTFLDGEVKRVPK
jgi:hypothetical protein